MSSGIRSPEMELRVAHREIMELRALLQRAVAQGQAVSRHWQNALAMLACAVAQAGGAVSLAKADLAVDRTLEQEETEATVELRAVVTPPEAPAGR